MSSYCIFLYSHSDYSDIWPLTFGQINKHIDLSNVDIYFCVNKLNDYKINEKIKVIFYDDTLYYIKRILYATLKLNYDYILFIHDDWVITNNFNNNYVSDLIKIMKDSGLLHVRSYAAWGGEYNQENIKINYNNINLTNIPNDAGYFISLQPGIWDMNLFRELYMFDCINGSKLEIASNSNYEFKRTKYNKFFYETNANIAEKSVLFPHIHTIAYGKWAFSNDKYGQLHNLLKEYNIDYKPRGEM
jgi:hypothetical protein